MSFWREWRVTDRRKAEKKKKKQKQNERAKTYLRVAKTEVYRRGIWGFVWGALILFDLEHRLDFLQNLGH